MACHQAIAKEKPAIRKLTEFDQDHKPVPWVRVYVVPAFVYWSHRTHLEAGMKCEMCHGPVGEMDVISKATNVTTMGGCVECHRDKQASTGCKACHESQSSQRLRPIQPVPTIAGGKIVREQGLHWLTGQIHEMPGLWQSHIPPPSYEVRR